MRQIRFGDGGGLDPETESEGRYTDNLKFQTRTYETTNVSLAIGSDPRQQNEASKSKKANVTKRLLACDSKN